MMYWFLLLFTFCSPIAAASYNPAEHAKSTLALFDTALQKNLDAQEYKVVITELHERIKQKPTSELYFALSITHLLDQQEEESFQAFFKALKTANVKTGAKLSSTEQKLFQELLPEYNRANPVELQQKVTEVLTKTPSATYLEFLLAASNANQHKYEPFFYLFYHAYLVYPDSYLSYKMQGVLATLLLQRVRTVEEKQMWRKQALEFFTRAFYEMPDDFALQKMMIYTANDGMKKETVSLILNTIIEKNVITPRSDVVFLVNHALEVGEVEKAERLIDKSKTWYQYSRAIAEIEKTVQAQKGVK